MADYMPRNRRSAAVLRQAGFVVEGYAREYLRIDGRWEDHVLTAITNPDWK
jgi:ribosomal-protein-alanine N-acetyltransferase